MFGVLEYGAFQAFPVLLGTLPFLSTDSRDADLLLSTLLALSAFLVDVDHGEGLQ